eukprot:c23631_g1_i1 orf=286-1464(+)
MAALFLPMGSPVLGASCLPSLPRFSFVSPPSCAAVSSPELPRVAFRVASYPSSFSSPSRAAFLCLSDSCTSSPVGLCRSLATGFIGRSRCALFHVCLSSGTRFLEQGAREREAWHGSVFLCRNGLSEESVDEKMDFEVGGGQDGSLQVGGGSGVEGGGLLNWVPTVFVLALWAVFIVYSFVYSPNQTPHRDQYFLLKLVGLKRGDGFEMNQVLVAVFWIMGLWPAVYTMLLIPTGRSSKGGVPVWPFTALSCFAGAFALLPYFGLWRPPPPPLSKDESDQWPLKILESKQISIVLAVAGVFVAGTALLAGSDSWKEFLQYFKESRFIHVMCLDFLALSSLAPFWVYNDATVRQRSGMSNWLIFLAMIPYLGPAFYLILRATLPTTMIREGSK